MANYKYLRTLVRNKVRITKKLISYYIQEILIINLESLLITSVNKNILLKYRNGFVQSIVGQRLDKHPAIRARNNRTNVIARC
jgi:hypothetical protein